MNEQLYRKCMVVYLDFLGFKAQVEESKTDQSKIKRISQILKEAKQWTEIISKPDEMVGIRAQLFSDSIILTSPNPDPLSVVVMMSAVALFQAKMTADGYFVRGAAVVGDHYEEAEVMFGPALTNASVMEKSAIWPRVVVSPTVWQQMERPVPEPMLSYLEQTAKRASDLVHPRLLQQIQMSSDELLHKFVFARGQDGLTHVNYLKIAYATFTLVRLFSECTGRRMPDFVVSDFFNRHRTSILNAVHDERVRFDLDTLSKYHCLAVYHNAAVDGLLAHLPSSSSLDEMEPNSDFAILCATVYMFFAFASVMGERLPQTASEFLSVRLAELSKDVYALRSSVIDLPHHFRALYGGERAK